MNDAPAPGTEFAVGPPHVVTGGEMDEPNPDVVRALSETICAQQKVLEQQYALIQKLTAAKADKTQEALDLAARMSARRGLANEVDMAVGLPGRGPGGN